MNSARTRLAATVGALAFTILCGLELGWVQPVLAKFGIAHSQPRPSAQAEPTTLEWPDLLPPQASGDAARRGDGSLATGLIQHGELASKSGGANKTSQSPWPPRLVEALGGTGNLEAPPRRLANAMGGFGNLRALQPRGGTTRSELDGKRVRIAGFIAPISVNGAEISEFLLVPFVGACVHVPPPPANQIVFVSGVNFELDSGLLHPVWITGTLRTEPVSTDLAQVGYRMEGAEIERYE